MLDTKFPREAQASSEQKAVLVVEVVRTASSDDRCGVSGACGAVVIARCLYSRMAWQRGVHHHLIQMVMHSLEALCVKRRTATGDSECGLLGGASDTCV